MENLKLKASKRTSDKKELKKDRTAGLAPAVLYGQGVKNIHLNIDSRAFNKVFEEAGSSSLVDIVIDDKDTRQVLVHDVHYHPVTDEVLNVDFYQVDMKKEIEAEVELEFTGTSPAVKEQGGILVKNFDTIEVKSLPADLPSEFTVDISSLATFDDTIKIKDLDVSEKVEILRDPESVIATVAPPRSEEELEKLDEEVTEDVTDVEGVEDKPAEGEEEGEEGEGKQAEEEKDGKEESAEGEEKKSE